MFQVIICMNRLPTLSTVDGGTERCVLNIPFESKFVDDVHNEKWSNCENIFQIDRELKTFIPLMGPALMRILLKQYPIYSKKGVVVP